VLKRKIFIKNDKRFVSLSCLKMVKMQKGESKIFRVCERGKVRFSELRKGESKIFRVAKGGK
jgi:hypothetical protein